MKNACLILVLSAIIPLGACSKSYICECKNPGPNTLEHFDIKKPKKSEAEQECQAKNGDPASAGLMNCHLK